MNLRSLTIPSLSLALVLAVAACGSETPETEPLGSPAPDAATQDDTTTAQEPTATDDAGQTTGDDDSQTTGEDSRATGGDTPGATSEVPGEVVAAIRTAEGEAGGTAYELDDQDDDGSWEIDVAVGNRSVEVTVSADGTQVLELDDDDLDDEDRRGLEAAQLTILDAIGNALAERPGTLDDVELGDERGTFAWEVTIDTESRDDVDVYVEVTNGEIVRVDG